MAESLAFVYHELRRARVLVWVREPEATYVPMPAVQSYVKCEKRG
jgi:hypothetical protein